MDRITSLIYTHTVPEGSVAESRYLQNVRSVQEYVFQYQELDLSRTLFTSLDAVSITATSNSFKQNLIFSMSFLKTEDLVNGNSSPS